MNWNWNIAKATCRPADLGSVRLSTKPATGALFTFRYNRQLQVLLLSHSFLDLNLTEQCLNYEDIKTPKQLQNGPRRCQSTHSHLGRTFVHFWRAEKNTKYPKTAAKQEDMSPCVQLLYHMTNPSCTENYERLSSHLLHCLHQSLEHEGTMLHEFTFVSNYIWGIGYQRAMLAQRYQIKIVIVWRWLECCQSYILCRRHFISW